MTHRRGRFPPDDDAARRRSGRLIHLPYSIPFHYARYAIGDLIHLLRGTRVVHDDLITMISQAQNEIAAERRASRGSRAYAAMPLARGAAVYSARHLGAAAAALPAAHISPSRDGSVRRIVGDATLARGSVKQRIAARFLRRSSHRGNPFRVLGYAEVMSCKICNVT